MKYKITITKFETKTVQRRGDYIVVDRRPWTEQELNEASMRIYGSVDNFLKENPLKEIRDYAPSWEGVEKEEVEVLKQTVETLDLSAVIKAVNGL